jgi:hypothetical protein
MNRSMGEADRRRIRRLASFVRAQGTATSLLTLLTPRLGAADRAAVTGSCTFAHAGLLVFPADVAAALAELPGLGVTPGPLVPSVVVRHRLAERYGLTADPAVWITHAPVTACPGGELELFLVCGHEPVMAAVAEDEQNYNRESHFALEGTGSTEAMSRTWDILVHAGGLLPDGGGYNPHENSAAGGRTVLYFLGPEPRWLATWPWPPRLELVMNGQHAGLLARHVHAAAAATVGCLLSGYPVSGYPAANAVTVSRNASRCGGNSDLGGSGQPGSSSACGSTLSKASAVCRWWNGFAGTEGSTPTGIVRLASSVSVSPRSVWPASSASATWDEAPRPVRRARSRESMTGSSAVAGQARSRRATVPGKSRAARAATLHPLDPARMTVGGPARAGRGWAASAAQSGAWRSRSGAVTSSPRRLSPAMIPGSAQKRAASMSSQSPPWISSSVAMLS